MNLVTIKKTLIAQYINYFYDLCLYLYSLVSSPKGLLSNTVFDHFGTFVLWCNKSIDYVNFNSTLAKAIDTNQISVLLPYFTMIEVYIQVFFDRLGSRDRFNIYWHMLWNLSGGHIAVIIGPREVGKRQALRNSVFSTLQRNGYSV